MAAAIIAYIVAGFLTYGWAEANGKANPIGRGVMWPMQIAGSVIKYAGKLSVSLFTKPALEQ
jgi:hypothetical protein